MSFFRTIRIATATVAVALTIVPLALAGGEPKNDSPFTRPAAEHATTQLASATKGSNGLVQGEPKNQAPFTPPAASQTPTVVVRVHSGFQWSDAAIGSAATLGLVLAAAGALVLVRTPRARKATSAL